MDEGNIAKSDEFKRYLERFMDLFHVQRRVKIVYLPGDNDVGGETEPLNVKKLERFQNTFKQSDFIQFGHIDMYKVNRLAYTIPKVEKGPKLLQGNRTRIVFSHLPLLFMPSGFVQQVVNQIRPHIIFTAHDHKSLHVSADTETGEERLAEMLPPGDGNRDTMLYAVLWLPSRFTQLYLYLVTLIITIMFLIMMLCQKICYKLCHKFRRIASNAKHMV
ncbi:hypothetical protein C0J52_20941 [Blattella germanica]|nr:hypothetical protein C0J52_20941 [Blattella germanica]